MYMLGLDDYACGEKSMNKFCWQSCPCYNHNLWKFRFFVQLMPTFDQSLCKGFAFTALNLPERGV